MRLINDTLSIAVFCSSQLDDTYDTLKTITEYLYAHDMFDDTMQESVWNNHDSFQWR
jgi:hypothetical protein